MSRTPRSRPLFPTRRGQKSSFVTAKPASYPLSHLVIAACARSVVPTIEHHADLSFLKTIVRAGLPKVEEAIISAKEEDRVANDGEYSQTQTQRRSFCIAPAFCCSAPVGRNRPAGSARNPIPDALPGERQAPSLQADCHCNRFYFSPTQVDVRSRRQVHGRRLGHPCWA